MKTKTPHVLYLISLLITVWLTWWFTTHYSTSRTASPGERKPLYWVAPMDPNFRQDGPGLSPMGMELVPVYEAAEAAPGVVSIQPQVINQLGVRTTQASSTQLRKSIRTVGNIGFDENQLYHVHPRVTGWINQLFIKSEGLAVTEGQPLFSLYSPELINAQEEYLLAVNRQQTRLITAAKARLQSLQISEQTIQSITRSNQVLQNMTFYAPHDGVVSHLAVREGFYVQPGDQVMSLADLSSVWLETELTEHNLAWVSEGTQVSMQLAALPGQQFSGEVDFVYPFLDQRSKAARVRLTFDNENGQLKPNMIADVTVMPAMSETVLAVPQSAVIRTAEADRVVWAQGGGQFKSVAVKLGRMGDEYVEVLDGLTAGDEVVISAQFLLDSESSKQSDLRRYAAPEQLRQDPQQVQSARTTGVINRIDGQLINISRDGIEKWNRPPATMDFQSAGHLSMPAPGSQLDFTFEIRGNDFIITAIHAVNGEPAHDH
ncbi:efflux RND transporter periplasmic adaptor subunit [Marinicella sediminis]|uniref:Efflux RND transporter periplasmic adaptor subunit n=1 Tax=Marinicella sediminis TaxID=1792834 RepID=A0ABV7J9B9_9GAMM|nr:efflux RND transporter periplasmic adaptor subunit [Marinicella sediminis]